MPQCSVPSCRNSGVHLFPKDPTLRKKWEKAIRRKKSATDYLRLCRDHFKESDYVGVSAYTGRPQMIRYLKKGVIPSIFPWTQQSITFSSTPIKEEDKVVTASEEKDLNDHNEISSQDYLQEKACMKIQNLQKINEPLSQHKTAEM